MAEVVIAYDLRAYLERLESVAPGCRFRFATEEADLRHSLPAAEVVVGWTPLITECCLENPKSPLKWIQSLNAGVDVIPLALCKQKGIYVTTASGVHANPISESVFAMLLAFTRGLLACFSNQLSGKWDGTPEFRASLGELHGTTIGVLGVGVVGSEIARIAKAFSMRVLGLDRTDAENPYVDEMYPTSQLSALLPQCDYVVNILPLSEQTRGLMGEAAFAQMKHGAFYVNVGRGPTTDTEALTAALENGHLAGAGLDVVEPEPLPSGHRLWANEKVIITPHFAGSTPHYDERAVNILMENLVAYESGFPPPRNRVEL